MSPVPTSVKHSDLQAALKPLYDLLGIDGMSIYSDIPLLISVDRISFAAVVGAGEPSDDRPPGLRHAGLNVAPHPQGGDRAEWAELAYMVVVDVDRWNGVRADAASEVEL